MERVLPGQYRDVGSTDAKPRGPNDLAPARGILIGLIWSVLIWAVVLVLWWL